MVGFERQVVKPPVSSDLYRPIIPKLGTSYRDVVTGWTGVATSTMQSLGTTEQVRLERLHPSDGTVQQAWFEVARLEPTAGAS